MPRLSISDNRRQCAYGVFVRLPLVLALLLTMVTQSNLAAGLVTVTFSGQVLNVFGNPFRVGIKRLNTVSGHFRYDDASGPSDPTSGCDCMGYSQQIAGGLYVRIGEATLRTDNYVVEVKNDFLQGTTPFDTLSITASSFAVNDVPFDASFFQINLDGPATSFPDKSLPPNPNLSGFTSLYDILDEVTTDIAVGILFRINQTSVVRTPEPAASVLLLTLGLAGCVGHRVR